MKVLGKVSLSDIKIMCCISSKNIIDSIPQDSPCTGVAWFSSYESKLKSIDSLTVNLTRICIYNDKSYSYYYENLRTKKIDDFINDLCQMIDDKRIDVLIFDNMYLPYDPIVYDDSGYENAMQTRIHELFKKIQIKNPNTLYGLMLRAVPDPGFNLPYLEPVVPFFVYPACDLVDCDYYDDVTEMPSQDPADQVEEFVKAIVSKVKSSKIYLVIQIGVYSSKLYDGPLNADTYTTFCSVKPSKYRRFCIDYLSNFYKKGKLVSTYKLAGAFLYTYDFDDYHCKCGCGCYAATTAINAGVQGSPEPELTKCDKTWTLRYKDRK
ncbi:Glycoside hydrolase superfamily [Cinara cedri]|uniref:Glycoside hydrolase superfamily n=1 Tax=Cinara cedri TaxID=506608 RepID=A0A5E4NEV4_9HEMI|nr:Glycoside hydrolase superfamily [Cinara cedri]